MRVDLGKRNSIMRAFVRLRRFLLTQEEPSRKLAELEQRLEAHDVEITTVFEAIRELMTPATSSSRKIGVEPRD